MNIMINDSYKISDVFFATRNVATFTKIAVEVQNTTGKFLLDVFVKVCPAILKWPTGVFQHPEILI